MTQEQLRQAVALDRTVYPPEYWLDEETGLRYLSSHPEIYTFAECGGTLAAYLNMCCIGERCFELLASGQENDLCISAEDILLPERGARNLLYFSSVAVHPEHRGRGLAQKMFARFADKLEAMRRHGIYFSEVLADAVSLHGENLCLSFGMRCESQTARGSRIFRLRLPQGEPNAALDAWTGALRGRRS